MAKPSKTCLNCRWEPRRWLRNYLDIPIGRCGFPTDPQAIAAFKFPRGTKIETPYIRRDRPKTTCPAWEPKE